MFWPCETRTSTCRSFATIPSGLYRFLAIAVLLDVKDIPQVGPLQWGLLPVRVRVQADEKSPDGEDGVTKIRTHYARSWVCHWPKYPLPLNVAANIGLPLQAFDSPNPARSVLNRARITLRRRAVCHDAP